MRRWLGWVFAAALASGVASCEPDCGDACVPSLRLRIPAVLDVATRGSAFEAIVCQGDSCGVATFAFPATPGGCPAPQAGADFCCKVSWSETGLGDVCRANGTDLELEVPLDDPPEAEPGTITVIDSEGDELVYSATLRNGSQAEREETCQCLRVALDLPPRRAGG